MSKPPKTEIGKVIAFRKFKLVPSLKDLATDELRNAVIRMALDTLTTRELRQIADRLHKGALQ